jgi:predicted Zn finger-like uncharacterized protein
MSMHLDCPHCEADIDADDVNLDRMVAKCRACNAVFSIESLVPGGRPTKPRAVDLPARMTVEPTGLGLRIRWPWFSWKAIPLVIFAVIWNGFLLFWMGIALAGRAYPMMLFGSLHAAVGLGLLYWTLATFLNRTTVDVADGEVRVRHAPVPIPGRRLAASAIRQLFIKEHISRGRNTTTVTYQLHAVTGDDKKVELVGNLESPEQARFLEQEIERHLRLTDAPVREEYRWR